MWDPQQLAEIAVLTDELQARGDLLGEWLALRTRMEGSSQAQRSASETEALVRRSRELRAGLGERLRLSEDPRFASVELLRTRGLISDLSMGEAQPGSLAALLRRPDAAFVMMVRLRGEAASLRACVDLLGGRAAGERGRALRELSLEVVDATGEFDEEASAALQLELARHTPELLHANPGLYWLEVDGTVSPLPVDMDVADVDEPAWGPEQRTRLGRGLSSTDAQLRRRALDQLRQHGRHAGQLQRPLLSLAEGDESAPVRAAALAVIAQLERETARAMFAILGDSARRRDDPMLRGWLAQLGRGGRR